jgi:hypothetical protein
MFYRKNLKLMVSLKLKNHRYVWWKTRTSFHVVVSKHPYRKCRCIQSSGIELSGLTLEPLASDAVLSQEEKEV